MGFLSVEFSQRCCYGDAGARTIRSKIATGFVDTMRCWRFPTERLVSSYSPFDVINERQYKPGSYLFQIPISRMQICTAIAPIILASAAPLSNHFLNILISRSSSAGVSVPCLTIAKPARLPCADWAFLPGQSPGSCSMSRSRSMTSFAEESAQKRRRSSSSLESRIGQASLWREMISAARVWLDGL
jgi:hypothetical protein